MKKLWFFLLLLSNILLLHALDDTFYFDDNGDFPETSEIEREFPEFGDEPVTPEHEKPRLKNRTWELSIANINFNISNTFVAARDFFQNPFYILWHIQDIIEDPVLVYKDPVSINIDDFFGGYQLLFGAAIKPFSFNFNRKDEWGIGLDIAHVSVTGNMALDGKMLSLTEANNEKFYMGMAAYVDMGIPIFFHYNDFKIKIRPAAYVPLVYTRPVINYTYKKNYQNPDTGKEGSYLEVNYDMRFYYIFDVQEDIMQSLKEADLWSIPAKNMGYDFGLSAEYPWSDQMDIGINIVNIPVPYAAARLYQYTQVSGTMTMDTSYFDLNDMSGGALSEEAYSFSSTSEEAGYNSDGHKIYRPFFMLFYAEYRPYYTEILSLIPLLGFSINKLYNEPGSVEAGLSARVDLRNIFITTVGINYNDRAWRNSIDFILNLRAFQLDIGLASQSPKLLKSWQGAGMSVNLGMKFGW